MLQRFGFSAYESRVYETLAAADKALHASAIAKISGVPRAKVYEVIARLVEKGIVMEAVIEKKKLYRAVELNIVVEKLTSEFESNIKELKNHQFAAQVQEDYVWNLETDRTTKNILQGMLEKSKQSIYISLWAEDFLEVKHLLEQKEDEGVEVEVLVLGEAETRLKNVHAFTRPDDGKHSLEKWRLLIVDSNDLIFGALHGEKWKAIRTNTQPFVKFFTEFFYHDVVLTEIVEKHYEDILQHDEKINSMLTKLRY